MFKFSDASDIYDNYSKKYKRHKKGAIILAPPGSGKTTYIRKLEEKDCLCDWIDSDDLFKDLGADWHQSMNDKLNYTRCDYLHEQSKYYGFRILGCLFYDYNPDAIVVLPFELHKKYLENRPDLDVNIVKEVRKVLEEKSREKNIPLFDNIDDAIQYINQKFD